MLAAGTRWISSAGAWFQREARVLATLNHPNIAAIYGAEEHAVLFQLPPGSSYAPAPDGKTLYVAPGQPATPRVVMVLVNGLGR